MERHIRCGTSVLARDDASIRCAVSLASAIRLEMQLEKSFTRQSEGHCAATLGMHLRMLGGRCIVDVLLVTHAELALSCAGAW